MSSTSRYQVVLLPAGVLAASHCTLAEALEYQRGYHEAVESDDHRAAIALEEAKPAAARLASSARSAQTVRMLRSA